jgi:hypothetical protein
MKSESGKHKKKGSFGKPRRERIILKLISKYTQPESVNQTYVSAYDSVPYRWS